MATKRELIVGLATLQERHDSLLEELKNIAVADPSTWDAEYQDQFQQWAQNRARTAVAKAGAK